MKYKKFILIYLPASDFHLWLKIFIALQG